MPHQERQAELTLLKTLYEQGRLSEADYHAALKDLGVDLATVLYQVETGGGAYVEGNVQAGTFAGRDVDGDAVGRDKNVGVDQREQRVEKQTNMLHTSGPVLSGTFHIYQQAPGKPELSEEAFSRVLDDYLTWVWSEYRFACLHGLQTLQGTGPHRKPLAAVYTSLRIRHRPAVEPSGRWWGEGGDMSELLTLGRRVAIIGGAGCGKTTYLAFVAASLAAALGGQPLDARLKPRRPDAPCPFHFWRRCVSGTSTAAR